MNKEIEKLRERVIKALNNEGLDVEVEDMDKGVIFNVSLPGGEYVLRLVEETEEV